MLIISIKVDAPAGQAIGIKEQLAMALEQCRDVKDIRVIEVREETPKQMSMLQ